MSWTKILLIPFLCLAAVGLILSLIVHAWAFSGRSQPLGEATLILHLGIFVVWFPALITATQRTRDCKSDEFWEVALQGCPVWMRCLFGVCFAYAIVNFFLALLAAPQVEGGPDAPTSPAAFRGFSGHWMAFYSAALAMLYSSLVSNSAVPVRRCLNGHPVPPAAAFCDRCGKRIRETGPDEPAPPA